MRNASLRINPLIGFIALAVGGPVFAGISCPSGYSPIGKGTCVAAPITTSGSGSASRRDNKLFAGINWKFGGVKGPEMVVGYQSVKVQSDKDVRGGRLEFTALLKEGFRPNSIRLSGLDGKTSAQGLLGGGYAFGQGFMLSGGLQIPYVTGGVDYVVSGGGLTPYVGVNTLSKQKVPRVTVGSTTCPPASDPGAGWFVASGPTLVGNQCEVQVGFD